MATEIKMPQLGLTMEEGTVERWLKAEGDPVKAGEPLLEITTDKLTNQVEAEADGILLKIVAPEGADVPVQGLLGWIGQPGEAIPDVADAAASRWEPPPRRRPSRRHLPRQRPRPAVPKRCWSSAAVPAAMWPPSGRPSWAPR